MRVLVIGHSGQLATALRKAKLPEGWILRTMGRPALDIRKGNDIARALDTFRPDAVINTAAYTAVDEAEEREREAFALNRDAPVLLARECARHDVPLVHVSTDYVFDGYKGMPYTETDETAPLNVYGRSKLAGENAVQDAGGRFCIIRTAWLFGPYGRNFLRSILERAQCGQPLRIVADQRGTPTCVEHLAQGLVHLLARWQQAPEAFPWNRIWHLAGTGEATWHGLAEAIMNASRRMGGTAVPVQAISTREYPARARRPVDSRLDCSGVAQAAGVRLPHWRVGVEASVRRLLEGEACE